MKILFVSEYFWPRPTGGEVWSWELCTSLAKTHNVTVLTTRHDTSPRKQERAGVHILRPVNAGSSRLSRWFATRQLLTHVQRQIARERPEVIHVMAYGMNVLVSRLAAREGIHCVTSIHSFFGDSWRYLSPFWRFLSFLERRRILRDQSSVLHVPSRYLEKKIKKDTGRKTTVVHNWLPKKFPRPRELTNTYVFVGSLEPVKNPLACIPIVGKNLLVVIGSGSLESELRKAAKDEGVKLTLIPTLSREAILAYLGGASLVLVPSHEESFSLVALEAVAQGTPVSGTPVGIMPELPILPFPPDKKPQRLTKTAAKKLRTQFSQARAIKKVLKLYKTAKPLKDSRVPGER